MLATRGNAARRDRTRKTTTPPTPKLAEAMGAIEEIIQHLPGEDPESLLVLAEEHGVPRREAEEALVHLEREGRAVRRTDEEGGERWEEPQLRGASCGRSHEAESQGVLQLYARDDLEAQRWKLVPWAVLCPTCGVVEGRANAYEGGHRSKEGA